jgi:hypothetical protein
MHDFELARDWVAREATCHERENERDRVKFEKKVRTEKGKSGGKPGKGKVKGKTGGKGKGKVRLDKGSKGNLNEAFSPPHPTFTEAEIRAFTDEEFLNIVSESSTLRFAFIWGDLPEETLVERCASNPLSEIEKAAQENVPWRGALKEGFFLCWMAKPLKVRSIHAHSGPPVRGFQTVPFDGDDYKTIYHVTNFAVADIMMKGGHILPADLLDGPKDRNEVFAP